MIRKATNKDINLILSLCKQNSWLTEQNILDCFANKSSLNLVYEHDNVVVGFLLSYVTADSCDIVYIYTQHQHRQKGIASELLKYLLKTTKSIFVEVNKTNVQAISLYKKLGFNEIFVRKNYYGEQKDAIVMQLKINNFH